MKTKKLSGFLLAQAMVAVVITILCVFTLGCVLTLLKRANKVNHHTNEAVFSYVQLKNFIDNSEYIYTVPEYSTNYKVVFDRKAKKTSQNQKPSENRYRLEQYNDMIRLTTSITGGHMPLLFNVKNARFKTDERHFEMEVIEKDNRKTQFTFKTMLRPKEDKTTNEKKKIEEKTQKATS